MNNPFEIIDARLSKIENLLLELKRPAIEAFSGETKDELLTVQAAADFLSLSVPTIYGLISKGELPVMKRSKRCYFSKVELMNYLKQGRKRSNTEINEAADTYLKNKKQ